MNTDLSHLAQPWNGIANQDGVRIPDPPAVQRDPYFAEYRRDINGETLRIRTWYAVAESPSGGYTCSTTVQYYSPNNYAAGFARAGGYGYCKQSAAIWHALSKILSTPHLRSYEGCGMESLHSSLIKWGWKR